MSDIVFIDGEAFKRTTENKFMNAHEYVLDDIEDQFTLIRTGVNFRFKTDREFRQAMFNGGSNFQVERYEPTNLPGSDGIERLNI